jgi:hypothetical protein
LYPHPSPSTYTPSSHQLPHNLYRTLNPFGQLQITSVIPTPHTPHPQPHTRTPNVCETSETCAGEVEESLDHSTQRRRQEEQQQQVCPQDCGHCDASQTLAGFAPARARTRTHAHTRAHTHTHTVWGGRRKRSEVSPLQS